MNARIVTSLLVLVLSAAAAFPAAAEPKDPGEAAYLAALDALHAGKHAEALAAAEKVIADHPDSAWFRKALFLKARALGELRRMKAAEEIMEREARRLLARARKHRLAGVIVEFADALARKPDPDDPGAPKPDYGKARKLYRKVLEMEIGRDLRDEVMFREARAALEGKDYGGAVSGFRAWLAEFDPDWTGPVGSAARLAHRKKENPPPRGKHVAEARYLLARAQQKAGRFRDARRNLEDLRALLPADSPRRADVDFALVATYRLGDRRGDDPDAGVHAARTFLEDHPTDPRAVAAAFWIAESLRVRGRADDAVKAYRDFAERRAFSLPAGEAATAELPDFGKSAAELADEWTKLAVYRIGEIRLAQREYEGAIEAFREYVKRFPNGSRWSDAQRSIMDAAFRMGVDAVAEKKVDLAREKFSEFLRRYPLDPRARQILFTLGQIRYARAGELEKAKAPAGEVTEAYREAVEEWSRLVSKYPRTDESSLALYRIGVIREEKLGDLEGALRSYRRLTWGPWARAARDRIGILTKKQLTLETERKFRTNETPRVKLTLRNIEKLTVERYRLDLEAYFRKTHGTGDVESLDVGLIQPDRKWEVKVPGYARYRPIEMEIEVPLEAGPGVCLLVVSEEDLTATTLVVRSDLDLIVKSSRREILVFAEDMRKEEPAAGVRLLLSDGKKVFAVGETGKDGVYRGRHERLAGAGDIRVFAIRDGHTASNVVGLAGLRRSTGLVPRGYLYTDRPAYLPGQEVGIRGILRDVSGGSYTVPEGKVYEVEVIDSRGRMIWREERGLSEFGTLSAEAPLGPQAPPGTYRVVAREKENPKVAWSASFRVESFVLEKMRLRLAADREVCFRGETVKLTVTAEYYWGEPLADRTIRVVLPDGRIVEEKTDDRGRLSIPFDTTGRTPGTLLVFRASLPGEEVRAEHRVMLARLGFGITVTPSRDLVLAGEPFDVRIATRLPGKKPVGKKLRLFVLRRKVPAADPVLAGVPWIRAPRRPAAEVTVLEKEVETDPRTGETAVRLSLDEGGRYLLRVAGEDRFGQPVSAEGKVTVSGEEDAVKLRFFSDTDTLEVGEKARVRLHSRLAEGRLALLTFDGETILSHRILRLAKGMNDVNLQVGHEHFPNFRVSVALLDDRKLYTAEKEFRVRRELRVSVRPLAESYVPGSPGKVEITVTDQLGRPVRAELSLALVNEALYALFPDRTPKILDYFQAGARRHTEFRTAGSSGFSYHGKTRPVIREILAEAARRQRRKDEEARLNALRQKLAEMEKGERPSGRPAATPSFSGLAGARARRALAKRKAPADKAQAGKALEEDRKLVARGGGGKAAPRERRELPAAGWWRAVVVTGKDGKAVVEVPLPETTTLWRLTARGVTPETLVGEARGRVLTKKEFFAEMKTPSSLLEGDEIRVLARLHNLTGRNAPAGLTLEVLGGPSFARVVAKHSVKIEAPAGGTAETLFPAVRIPADPVLRFRLTATSGKRRDLLVRDVPVRAYGLSFSDHAGGTATGDTAAGLTLPGDRPYTTRRLTIEVGARVERALVDLALRGPFRRAEPAKRVAPPWYGHPGSDLLAVAAVLDTAREAALPEADRLRLLRRARSLVSGLTATQLGDGGWAWRGTRRPSDLSVTAATYWALARARKLGLGVDSGTLDRAKRYLENAYRSLRSDDYRGRAIILHALSTSGDADFARANRLYRERNSLGAATLARTALVFANLGRPEIAKEVLTVLLGKAREETRGDRKLCSWTEFPAGGPLRTSPLETTALTLLALIRILPDSDRIRPAAEYLLDRRGPGGFVPAPAHGPAVAALAAWFARGRRAATDYRLRVLLNGAELAAVSARDAEPVITIRVPPERLKEGENVVAFRMEGRGEYTWSATLTGFSPKIEEPKGKRLQYPYVRSRRYLHAPLTYRNREIGVKSTSKVSHVEIGQRVRVRVDLSEKWAPGDLAIEEPIPAGLRFVPGSLKGTQSAWELADGRLVLYFPSSKRPWDYEYELVGYATGTYRVLPTTIRDTRRPGLIRLGKPAEIVVLAPGEKSEDPYRRNHEERYTLGRLCFEDGRYAEALRHLEELREQKHEYEERNVARMLLWIYTSKGFYDARKIVDVFEVLRERYPDLEVPFDRILAVGRAYRDIGEYERALLVFKATIDASFLNDSNVSAVLEDEGRFLGSVEYQEGLWREYPDTPAVRSSYFALSQALYRVAPKAADLAKEERRMAAARGAPPPKTPDRIDMLERAIGILESFLRLYPKDPLADDAAFSEANAWLDLEQYEKVVSLCRGFVERFPRSEFRSGFEYMIALGEFWQRRYDEALAAAEIVAEGRSRDRDLARYIAGQIYHAEGKPAKAIEWYRKVADLYPDAKEAIAYFEKKSISMPEVTRVKPGEKVEIEIRYRNVAEASLRVYRVDLMKLYLREKNLSTITKVHLAGIAPQSEKEVRLGDGRDYRDRKKVIDLDLSGEGAYLVICRGDDLFTSGLVLVTPLVLEVQEDPASGRVRVNVIDRTTGGFAAGVHVKVIGSADQEFRSGDSDLRGIVVADGIRGKATVIARSGDARYAFYRGKRWLGRPEAAPPAPRRTRGDRRAQQADFLRNLRRSNEAIQEKNYRSFDRMRRARQKGVEVQQAR